MMTNQILIKTYAELCSDPDLNPMGIGASALRGIAAQYVQWGVGLSVASLKEDILLDMGVSMSGGIGVMVSNNEVEGGTLQVLHSVYKHAGRDTHRGKIFASLGDAQGVDIDTVVFDDALLALTPETLCAKEVAYQQELFAAASDETELVPPFTAETDQVQRLSVRRSVFIPFPLIPYVLDKNLTAREAITMLVPVIQSEGLEDFCQPLIEFLIVASTSLPAAAGAAPGAPQKSIVEKDTAGVTPERLLPVVRDRRERLLYVHLPDLKPKTVAASDPALLGIMNSIQDVHTAHIADVNDRRTEREQTKAGKTVEEKWPNFVDRLCKLCNVGNWEDLPSFWHEAAANKKGSGCTLRNILQDAVEEEAHKLNVQPPHITVAHASAVQNFLFISSTENNLEGGLMPFTISPPGAVSRRAQERQELEFEQTADFATFAEGVQSMTASDARALRASSAYVPVDMEEADLMLQSYTAVLAALLGDNHPNVLGHRQSLLDYREVRPHLRMIMNERLGSNLSPATLVYYYQVKHRFWFKRQWRKSTHSTLPPPRFSQAFELFAEGYNMSWLPNTSHVDLLHKLRRVPGTPTGGPSTPQQENGEPTSPQRTRVRNNNRDSRLFGTHPLAVKLKAIRIKDLLEKATTPAPVYKGPGPDRCYTWQLKGSCYDDCLRVGDHRALVNPEKDQLYNWVKLTLE